MNILLTRFALYLIFIITVSSCNSAGGSGNYERLPEKEPVLFDGVFKGRINQTDITVSIQNISGQISGTFTETDKNFTLTGNINASNILNAQIDNGLISYNCQGYYSGYNLVMEFDEDFVNLMRLAMILNDQSETAMQLENKLVLQKQ